MKEKRDAMFFCCGLNLCVCAVCILCWLASGGQGTGWPIAALVFALSAFAFSVIAKMIEYLDDRMPMIDINEYGKLKRRQVKRMKFLKETGQLTQAEIQRQKTAFLLSAEKIGILRESAEEDFDMEIRRRVMR